MASTADVATVQASPSSGCFLIALYLSSSYNLLEKDLTPDIFEILDALDLISSSILA